MLRFKLNEDGFKEFYGSENKQMPKLIEEGRIPLSVAGLMQKRLEVLAGSSDEKKTAWWDNYFYTGDGLFYHPNGNIKVVLGAQPIRDLTPYSNIVDGALVLDRYRDSSIAVYSSLDGAEFRRSDWEKHVGRLLTKEEVKKHPIWNALAGDKALLNEYVDATFAQGKERYGYDKMMRIWVASPRYVATGRHWFVDYLYANSNAGGNGNLNGFGGHLIGVAPNL